MSTDYGHVERVLGAIDDGDVITVNHSNFADSDKVGELVVDSSIDVGHFDDGGVGATFSGGFGVESYAAVSGDVGVSLYRLSDGAPVLEAIVETVEVIRCE